MFEIHTAAQRSHDASELLRVKRFAFGQSCLMRFIRIPVRRPLPDPRLSSANAASMALRFAFIPIEGLKGRACFRSGEISDVSALHHLRGDFSEKLGVR